MKSLSTYINEKLIIKQKQIITISSRQELGAAILDHFKSHNGDLNDIDVSKLKKEDFYSLFYNLGDEFYDNNITEIDISDWNLKELYYDEYNYMGMFENCGALEKIILPDCLEVIGKSAFHNCNNLDNIIIPDSVISIDKNVFSYCSRLHSMTIPDSVTEIGSWVFDHCSTLSSVTIPSSVTKIDVRTFSDCSDLTTVTIPDSVTEIGARAFSRCISLTSVIIPDSITDIGYYAFYGCNKLTITVPNEHIKELVRNSGFNGEIIINK